MKPRISVFLPSVIGGWLGVHYGRGYGYEPGDGYGVGYTSLRGDSLISRARQRIGDGYGSNDSGPDPELAVLIRLD